MHRASAASESLARYRDWIRDPAHVNKWMLQYDLRKLLEQNNGFVSIPDFLPPAVADGLLQHLKGLPEVSHVLLAELTRLQGQWGLQKSTPDYVETNISHRFRSAQVIVAYRE